MTALRNNKFENKVEKFCHTFSAKCSIETQKLELIQRNLTMKLHEQLNRSNEELNIEEANLKHLKERYDMLNKTGTTAFENMDMYGNFFNQTGGQQQGYTNVNQQQVYVNQQGQRMDGYVSANPKYDGKSANMKTKATKATVNDGTVITKQRFPSADSRDNSMERQH